LTILGSLELSVEGQNVKAINDANTQRHQDFLLDRDSNSKILTVLKKIEIHMAELTGLEINDCDVEELR